MKNLDEKTIEIYNVDSRSRNPVIYDDTQYNTIQYNTIQYNTIHLFLYKQFKLLNYDVLNNFTNKKFLLRR
jgi:hypothetical protein